MGEAFVVDVSDKPNSINVRVIMDEDRIDAAIIAMNSTIENITIQIAQRQSRVNSNEIELDSAKQSLALAISNEEPRVVIIQLKEQVIIATSNLVNSKTDLSVSTYQLSGAEKRLITLQTEKTANQMIIAIPMADSGTTILPGTSIGIAEVARISGRGSDFVALPSERPGHDVIYEPARDGSILPKIAEDTYGWWYNTMIEPSAQIFRPRYWTATLLLKDDQANTGTILISASKNFNEKPFNSALYGSVTFEYETTNSLTFKIGDLVLIEFTEAGGGEPLIIGFANTGEKPEVFGIVLYQIFNQNNNQKGFYLIRSSSGDVPIDTEEVSTVSMQGSKSSALALAFKALEGSAPGWTFTIREGSPSFTSTHHELVLTDQGTTLFPSTEIKKAMVSNGSLVTSISANLRGVLTKSGEPTFSNFISNGVSKSLLGFEPSDIGPKGQGVAHNIAQAAIAPGTFDDGVRSGSFNLSSSGNQSQEFDTVTTFSKLSAWQDHSFSLGAINMPSDWLFANSQYLVPPADNQFTSITEIERAVNPINSMLIFKDVVLWQSFGPPSNDYICNPIATNGNQNLLAWSERLDLSLPEQSSLGIIGINEGVIKSPDCVDKGAGRIFAPLRAFTSGTIFRNRTASNLIGLNTYVVSAFVRRDSYIFIDFGDRTIGEARFDLLKGEEILSERSANITDANIVAHDGEWWRVWVTFALPLTKNVINLSMTILNYGQGLNISYTADGLNGIALWGMQVNEGVLPINYVKTTGTIIP